MNKGGNVPFFTIAIAMIMNRNAQDVANVAREYVGNLAVNPSFAFLYSYQVSFTCSLALLLEAHGHKPAEQARTTTWASSSSFYPQTTVRKKKEFPLVCSVFIRFLFFKYSTFHA